MKNRNFDVLNIIMNIFADMNFSPDQYCPKRTIWNKAMNDYSLTHADEFNAAIDTGLNDKLFTFRPGAPAGLGSLALTEKGYNVSRSQKLNH